MHWLCQHIPVSTPLPPFLALVDSTGEDLAQALRRAQAVGRELSALRRARLREELLQVAQCLEYILTVAVSML